MFYNIIFKINGLIILKELYIYFKNKIMRSVLWHWQHCLVKQLILQHFMGQIIMVNKLEHSFKSMEHRIKLIDQKNWKLVIKQDLINKLVKRQLVVKQLVIEQLSVQRLMIFELVDIKHVIQLSLMQHIQLLVHWCIKEHIQ